MKVSEDQGGGMVTGIGVIATRKAPGSVGPYSQAIRAGGFIFCAGQAAFDPATAGLVEGGIKEQTRQVLKEMNEAYAEFFTGDRPPARSTVQGARWPEGSLVAIEAIAVEA